MLIRKFKTPHTFFVFSSAILLGVLNGCEDTKVLSKTPEINCSNEIGTSSVVATLIENGKKSIQAEHHDISASTVMARLNTLDMSVQNIRTSKTDPNSTKVYCEAEIVIVPSTHLINDANASLKALGNTKTKDIAVLLENMGLRPSRAFAGGYETTIGYSLQPTDDGKTVVSVVEGGDTQLILGVKDLILWSMAKKSSVSKQDNIANQDALVQREVTQKVVMPKIEPAVVAPSYPMQKTHLQCSIGNTIASRPCLVSEEMAVANTPLTIRHFGQNGTYRLITIVWPDKDVSRYAVIDGLQLINLRKPNSGYYHLDYQREGQIILNDGLNILRDGSPYISLW